MRTLPIRHGHKAVAPQQTVQTPPPPAPKPPDEVVAPLASVPVTNPGPPAVMDTWVYPILRKGTVTINYAAVAGIVKADKEFANWLATVAAMAASIELANFTFCRPPMPDKFVRKYGGDGFLHLDKIGNQIKVYL